MDMMVPGGFREAQNLYFSRYDGQAVTFRELLSTANEVLMKHTGQNLSQFERWFDQQGTPQVQVEILTKEKPILRVTQFCPHPKTKEEQKPFLIPFSYEFIKHDGSLVWLKKNCILSEKVHEFELPGAVAKLAPIFMHGYSAPVILHYDYSLEDLACLMQHATDPFNQWEAGQNYALLVLQKFLAEEGKGDCRQYFVPYAEALKNPKLSPLIKAQLLEVPSLRAIAQKTDDYDFAKLRKVRDAFIIQLASVTRPQLEALLNQHEEPVHYEPTSEQMQVRELRNRCWNLLARIDSGYRQNVYENYLSAKNFNNSVASLASLANLEGDEKELALADFYHRWKSDKLVFNSWLRIQSASSCCTIGDLKKLMAKEGYDSKNPNHIRSVLLSFMNNLSQYHDPKGEGYAFIVGQILEVAKSNELLAHKLVGEAFIDFPKLPKNQQTLMRREMERMMKESPSPQTYDLVKNILYRKM